jgi:hypothetical protein
MKRKKAAETEASHSPSTSSCSPPKDRPLKDFHKAKKELDEEESASHSEMILEQDRFLPIGIVVFCSIK